MDRLPGHTDCSAMFCSFPVTISRHQRCADLIILTFEPASDVEKVLRATQTRSKWRQKIHSVVNPRCEDDWRTQHNITLPAWQLAGKTAVKINTSTIAGAITAYGCSELILSRCWWLQHSNPWLLYLYCSAGLTHLSACNRRGACEFLYDKGSDSHTLGSAYTCSNQYGRAKIMQRYRRVRKMCNSNFHYNFRTF